MEKTAIETQLADPALYLGQTGRVTELQKSVRDIERRIAEAEHDWPEAHAALEAG